MQFVKICLSISCCVVSIALVSMATSNYSNSSNFVVTLVTLQLLLIVLGCSPFGSL